MVLDMVTQISTAATFTCQSFSGFPWKLEPHAND
jgi:hypothetical protein